MFKVSILKARIMKNKFSSFAVIFLFAGSMAHADYDPADDPKSPQNVRAAKIAREKAAAQKLESAKNARAADLAAKRARLGKSADGKSDAEVDQLDIARATAEQKKQDALLADSKVKMTEANAAYKAQTGKSMDDVQKMSKSEQTAFYKKQQDTASAGMKAMTGKSTEEMMKMSPAEMDAFLKKMEAGMGKSK